MHAYTYTHGRDAWCARPKTIVWYESW
jgi:hypothetical protein